MIQNSVKRILREGGMALGTYVGGIADPQVVEIIGHAGFDAAFIDLEHTSFDLRDVQLMVMAAERMGIAPIVRTPGFDPAFILRLLDMGVQGLQLPHVNSAAAGAGGGASGALRAARRARHDGRQPRRGVRQGPRRRAHGGVEPRDHARHHDRGAVRARRDRRDRVHRGRGPGRGRAGGHVAGAGRAGADGPPEARRDHQLRGRRREGRAA